jgi:hypothetical protein
VPESARVDARLALGAILFGAGWGLGGYCPGPALVSLATLGPPVLLFVAGMLLVHAASRPPASERAAVKSSRAGSPT